MKNIEYAKKAKQKQRSLLLIFEIHNWVVVEGSFIFFIGFGKVKSTKIHKTRQTHKTLFKKIKLNNTCTYTKF